MGRLTIGPHIPREAGDSREAKLYRVRNWAYKRLAPLSSTCWSRVEPDWPGVIVDSSLLGGTSYPQPGSDQVWFSRERVDP